MIPRQGRRHLLNQDALYHPMTHPQHEDDAPVPTLIVGGIRVSAYVDTHGVFRVSLATDEDAIDPRMALDADGNPAIQITVNDANVFEAGIPGLEEG